MESVASAVEKIPASPGGERVGRDMYAQMMAGLGPAAATDVRRAGLFRSGRLGFRLGLHLHPHGGRDVAVKSDVDVVLA